MDSPPVLFEVGSELGESYIAAMELAGEYAYAGRDIVVAKVLEILGAEAVHEVHNHHNFAWREEHFGRTYWVVRKGCTPARPGQEGFVGGSMGDDSVILEGVESRTPTESLYSTVHGAGRVMSRTKAAGRVRRRKRWACSHRDCDRVFDIDGVSSSTGMPKGVCPDHPTSRLRKVWVEEQISPRRRRLAGRAGTPARAGHRAGRRRRGRGAGGVQAPAGGARRARRLDPGEAHAPPARRRHGRPRRVRPVQGLRAARAALSPFKGRGFRFDRCGDKESRRIQSRAARAFPLVARAIGGSDMNDEPDEGRREQWGPRMSRRTLLRRGAIAGIAGATAGTLLTPASEAAPTGATVETALKFLNGWEFDYVTAMAETIWPTDDLGPGARWQASATTSTGSSPGAGARATAST